MDEARPCQQRGAWHRALSGLRPRLAPCSGVGLGLALPFAFAGVPRAADLFSQIAIPAGAAVAAILAISLPVRWLLYGVILALPFDNYAVPVGPLGISVSDALLVVVTLRWLLTALYRGGRIARSELYLPAALFYVLLLPSFFVTFDFGISLRQAFSILMMLLTAIVTANLLRSERRLMGAVMATLAASLVMSALALLQLAIWTRYRISPLQSVVDVVQLGGVKFLRLTGTTFDPNYLALYLVVPLVLGLFVALEGQVSSRYKAFAWLVVGLDLAVFVMTFSRGGWVTLLAFMAAFVLLRARAVSRAVWLGMLVAVVIAAPVVAALVVSINPASVVNRLSLLQLGLGVMAKHPLVGTGLGTFMYLPQNVMRRFAHSTYIQVGADAGIPALLAFLSLAAVVVFNALRARRVAQPGVARTILTGCLFALGCVALQSAFLNALVLKHLWVLVGMTSAAAALARTDAPDTEPAPALAQTTAPG